MNNPTKLSEADVYPYVLYVNSKQDEIVKKARACGILSMTHVQEIRLLRNIPDWLHDVPILVDTNAKKGYRNEAIDTFLNTFEVPSAYKNTVSSTLKRKQLWSIDTERASAEQIDPRMVPMHMRMN